VQAWLEGEYPGIDQRARAEGAEIHRGDETALLNTDVRGRSFAPAGKTPVSMVVGSSRQKLNADLKQEMGKRVPVRTKARLREATNEHMAMLEQNPGCVTGYFQLSSLRLHGAGSIALTASSRHTGRLDVAERPVRPCGCVFR